MAGKLPLHPKHPERTCWGCDLYCPAESLACANGTIRTQHPIELFGEDWLEWTLLRASRYGGQVEHRAPRTEEPNTAD